MERASQGITRPRHRSAPLAAASRKGKHWPLDYTVVWVDLAASSYISDRDWSYETGMTNETLTNHLKSVLPKKAEPESKACAVPAAGLFGWKAERPEAPDGKGTLSGDQTRAA